MSLHRLRMGLGVVSVVGLGCASPPNHQSSATNGGSSTTAGAGPAQGGPSAGAAGTSQPTAGEPATDGGEGGTGGSSGSGGTGGAGMAAVECGVDVKGQVVFSPPSGTFQNTVTVTLSSAVATDELRYTTDHSAPTMASPRYTAPLTFEASTDLRVQIFAQGSAVGAPSGAVYVAQSGDATHDLPVLVLDSFGQVPSSDVDERDYVDAAVLGFQPAAGTTSLTSPPSLAAHGAFHVRGQSSSRYEKKPYRLELRAADTTDRDCPMFGMPSESDWVLHSPFPDKSLIRNAFVYSLGKEMGLAAPRTALVELYVNSDGQGVDSADYQGVYLLVETIKNQKSRLNLQQLKPADTMLPALAGGYIFKFEWAVANLEQPLPCPSGQSNCWNYVEVVDPKPWVPAQQQYMTEYLQQVVTALHSTTPSDPTTGYPAFLDVDSFVNMVIISELTRNLDAYVRSHYMHKDREGKLTAGPLWDYDLIAGVGTNGSTTNLSTTGFQHQASQSRLAATVDWYPLLLKDASFQTMLVARYKQLRQGVLSDAQLAARMTTLSTGLAGGAARNFKKWNNLATERIGNFQTPTANTWDGQLTAMRTWLTARTAWLDTQWL
jgi:hypothetical protein